MSIEKDLTLLVQAGIIDEATETRIQQFYHNRQQKSPNYLLLLFGILGAVLVGLGIILIVAHNWSNLSKTLQTVLAFVPLLIGQIACIYTLTNKNNNTVWREASAIFLCLAIGANISLVGQIYGIIGSFSGFLLSWVLLGLPVVYAMRSGTAAVFYLVGITMYMGDLNTWDLALLPTYHYWFLLAGIVPFYMYLRHKATARVSFTLFNYLLPLSIAYAYFSLISQNIDELILVAYLSLFAGFYAFGISRFFVGLYKPINGWIVIGTMGMLYGLFACCFQFIWEELTKNTLEVYVQQPVFWLSLLLSIASLFTIAYHTKIGQQAHQSRHLLAIVSALFFIPFLLGRGIPFMYLLVSLLMAGIGIVYISHGAKQSNLGILNLGLLVVSIIIGIRFFDANIGFAVKGLAFMVIGIGFFIANLWLIRKMKTQKHEVE